MAIAMNGVAAVMRLLLCIVMLCAVPAAWAAHHPTSAINALPSVIDLPFSDRLPSSSASDACCPAQHHALSHPAHEGEESVCQIFCQLGSAPALPCTIEVSPCLHLSPILNARLTLWRMVLAGPPEHPPPIGAFLRTI
jgi:hypothetical protein